MFPVAVTAVAAHTPLGADLAGTFEALASGASAVGPIQGFDASGFGDPKAAQVFRETATAEDDPTLRILGRHGRLLEEVIERAHADAKLEHLARERLGLFVALGMVDALDGDLAPAVEASLDEAGELDLARFYGGAFRLVHPLWPLTMLNNVAVGQIAIDLDVRGDNLVLASGADASVRSLIEAAGSLSLEASDSVLAGGVSEIVAPARLARLALRGELQRGAVPGEAAAAVALAREAPAPQALLAGAATAFGPPDEGAPGVDAFRRAAEAALAFAGGPPDACFLAGGPRAWDAQRKALETLFGEPLPAVGTAEGLGETGPAAPFVDLALAVLSLARGRLPVPLSGSVSPSRPLRRILVWAAGDHGGAGALVLEATP